MTIRRTEGFVYLAAFITYLDRVCISHADVTAAINIAAGHAVTARGGDGVARPVNREPHLLLPSV